MNSSSHIIAGAGLGDRARKSRWPARLDFAQSASGLLLALFMWGHMFFVSSILISKDAMWTHHQVLRGLLLPRRAASWLRVGRGGVRHRAVRRPRVRSRCASFRSNYRQFSTYRGHMRVMQHEDTTLWFWQVFTGFALFFLASVHLYLMLTRPDRIGPFESADRVWSDYLWPLYLLLLLAVELHGGIGLYRLAVKWGWVGGEDPNATRRRLKKLKWGITVFFLVLGLATLAAYIKIGIEHQRPLRRALRADVARPRPSG